MQLCAAPVQPQLSAGVTADAAHFLQPRAFLADL